MNVGELKKLLIELEVSDEDEILMECGETDNSTRLDGRYVLKQVFPRSYRKQVILCDWEMP